MTGKVRVYRRELSSYSGTPLCSDAAQDEQQLNNKQHRGVKTTDKSKKTPCLDCCKRFFTFLISHLGLSGLVVAYAIAGGFIFRALEAPHEMKERKTVSALRQEHVMRLWNVTVKYSNLYEENWTRIADGILLNFQTELYKAIKEKGWDGLDGADINQWSYTGALLYSTTVLTTIGYGHITPKTTYGRLVTIFYALIGIPLTLLCLTRVGAMLGDCFRFFYKHFCRFLAFVFLPKRSDYRRKSHITYTKQSEVSEMTLSTTGSLKDKERGAEKPVRVPILISIFIAAGYIFGGAVLFSIWEENWDYLIGSYFCFITLSTIGFGDFVPGTSLGSWSDEKKSIICALYLVLGLSVIAMCFNLMQEEVRAKFRWLGYKIGLLDTSQKI